MIVSATNIQIGQDHFRTHTAVGHSVAVHVADRPRLIFDTRFLPAAPVPARDRTSLWITLSGSFAWRGPTAGCVEGPSIVALSERQFHGEHGVRPWAVRSWGGELLAIDFRVPEAMSGVDCGAAPVQIEASGGVVRAAEAYAVAAREGGPSLLQTPLRRLTEALVEAGVFRPSVLDAVTREQPEELTRLWEAITHSIDNFRSLPNMKNLAAATGCSLRTLARTVDALDQTIALRPGGWRFSMFYARLSVASLFLSVPGASVAEVARKLGYRNVQALTNAFQRAGMPRPSEYAMRVATWPY